MSQERHRGLVRQEPDLDLAEMHVVKAEHNLKAAIYFEKGRFSDWSASAFFYCIYHCFLAVLRKHGYESRNQECTFAAVEFLRDEKKLSIDKEFVDLLKLSGIRDPDHTIIRTREDFQYGVKTEFKRKEEFDEFEQICKKVIDATREIIRN